MAVRDTMASSLERLHNNIKALEEQQARLGVIKKPPYIPDQDRIEALKKVDEYEKNIYLLKTTDDFFQMLCDVYEKSEDMYGDLAMRLGRTEGNTKYFPVEKIEKIAKDCIVALLLTYGPYIDIEFFIYLFTAKVIHLRLHGHQNNYRSKDYEFRYSIISALSSTGLITKQRASEILEHI
jgi:hypothetical protein